MEMKAKGVVLEDAQVPGLLSRLDSLLPYSIPLARRLRFHLDHPSETARVFVAVGSCEEANGDGEEDRDRAWWDRWLTASTSSSSSSSSSSLSTASQSRPDEPWVAAHIDLANAGQTHVWLFTSWERPASEPPTPLLQVDALPQSRPPRTPVVKNNDTAGTNSIHQSLMTTLYTYIHNHLVPLSPTNPPPADWLELQRTGKYLSTPYSRSKIIFGTVHEDLWSFFPEHAVTRRDPGYWKYIFFFDSSSPSSPAEEAEATVKDEDVVPAPRGRRTEGPGPGPGHAVHYRFGTLGAQHLQAVLDRTPIPRTLKTLSQLPNLGIFLEKKRNDDIINDLINNKNSHSLLVHATESRAVTTEIETDEETATATPIAWGFLGKDDSLSSLHTEPSFRGAGLAVTLGREILRRQCQRQLQLQCRRGEGRDEGEGDGGGEKGWWAHADVSATNAASRRVMEKLGGTALWRVAWIEVDLERLLSMPGQERQTQVT